MNRELFYIEDHALLYGLLGKYAEALFHDQGIRVLKQATVQYCRERGRRMAMRCLRDGRELNMQSFLLYAEYADIRRLSKSRTDQLIPRYLNTVTQCAWHDTWKKYSLEKYGAIYCSVCDESVLYGFSPDLTVIISRSLSCGEDCCRFEWCCTDFRDEQEFKDLMIQKYQNADVNMRDFLYHTAHVLATLSKSFSAAFGGKGSVVSDRALEEYARIMGYEKLQMLQDESHNDFTEV